MAVVGSVAGLLLITGWAETCVAEENPPDSLTGFTCSGPPDPAGIATLTGLPSTVLASWLGFTQEYDAEGEALYIDPPDVGGAVGPNGVIATVNTRMSYYDKSGALIWGPISLVDWWQAVRGVDPKVLYDRASERFYVVMIETYIPDSLHCELRASYLRLAVSNSSDPQSPNDWYRFDRINITENIQGNLFGADFPCLGVDSQAFYVTFNMYPLGCYTGLDEDVQHDVEIVVFNKASLNSAQDPPIHTIVNTAPLYAGYGKERAFTLQPATPEGPTNPGNVAYFAECPRVLSDSVRVWAMVDPLGSHVLSWQNVHIPSNGGPVLTFDGRNRGPNQCEVIGEIGVGTTTVSNRTLGAFWFNGAMWFSHSAGGCIARSDRTNGRSIVYYYKVNTNGFPSGTPTLGESGGIDGGPGVWNYLPTIGGNSQGDVCIVYNQSSYSANICPRILYTTRRAGDSSFEPPQILKESPSHYHGSRWGDFGTVSADPTDDTFWVASEFARSSQLQDYGTWWANVKPHCLPCGNPQIAFSACGKWDPVGSNWPAGLAPTNMVLTRTGKVLAWRETNSSNAHYWDPITYADQVVALTSQDTTLQGGGQVALGDGRILIVGGEWKPYPPPGNEPVGIARTTLFDPEACATNCSWVQRPNMWQARWNPTATLLPDGRVLSTSGWRHFDLLADAPESFASYSGVWTRYLSATKNDMSLLPFMYVDPNPNVARVVYVGPGASANAMYPFVLQPAQRIGDLASPNPMWNSNVGDYALRGGASVAFNGGLNSTLDILKSGGTPPGGGTATASGERLGLDALSGLTATTTWPMCAPRAEHHLIALPDGSALAVGGSTQEDRDLDQCSNAVTTTELWNPETQGWSTVGPMVYNGTTPVPRMFGSTALLLPDARVLVAGGRCNSGNGCPGFPNEWCASADFYSPPYLYRTDGTPISDSERPSISGSPPMSVVYGEGLSFGFSPGSAASGLTQVSLIRPGAVTYSTDMEQRCITLRWCRPGENCIEGVNPQFFDVGPPPNVVLVSTGNMPTRNQAPPGYYMLFLVNDLSRPSKANFVVLWEVIQGTVAHSNLVANEDGTFDIDFGWKTTAKATDGDLILLSPPGGGGVNPLSQYSSITADGLGHTWHMKLWCVPGKWTYQVRSKRPKYATGDGLSVSTSTAKTFNVNACIEP